MEYINWSVIYDMALDFRSMSADYASSINIWRYMLSSRAYNITHIVVGQTPYHSSIVPFMGASFSQLDGSRNTPTTKIFSLHFNDKQAS